MRINHIIYIVLVFSTYSCGGSDKESEVVDFDDYAGSTGTEVDTANDSEIAEEESLFSVDNLVRKMMIDYDTTKLSEGHPIDRFGYSSSKKLKFSGKNEVPYGKSGTVTPTAEFYYYSFVDSNKTINAFYNYLDMLAEEGEGGPVKLNQDVDAIKMPPMFMVVYDTVIVSAKYLCEHEENDWDSFQDSILIVYGNNYKHQINVGCGGPLKWK